MGFTINHHILGQVSEELNFLSILVQVSEELNFLSDATASAQTELHTSIHGVSDIFVPRLKLC